MKFWKLESPNYIHGGWDDAHINGKGWVPYRMPLSECEACGHSERSLRHLDIEPPRAMRKRVELNRSRGKKYIDTLKYSAFNLLREELEAAYANEGHPLALKPGDQLGPTEISVPSFPVVDLLWPHFSILVSPRISALFVDHGATFHPVTWKKVGFRRGEIPVEHGNNIWANFGYEPELEISLSPGYRPGSLFARLLGLPAPSEYRELRVPSGKPNPRRGWKLGPACPACGNSPLVDWDSGTYDFETECWNGLAIFEPHTTGGITVTDEFKRELEAMGPTNVVFVPVPEQFKVKSYEELVGGVRSQV